MLTLLTNAELYSPEPRGRQHLLVAGNRIAWIGPQMPVLPPSLGVQVRDLHGDLLVPGFVDAHVHVTGGGGEAGPNTQVAPLSARALTRAGVTTVVGLLGTDDLTRSTASLVARVLGLRADGMSAWCHTGGYHVPPTTLTGSVRGDIVYVDPIIGVGELAISDHRSSQPTLEELLRIAADAHVAGLMSGKAGVVHLHVGDGSAGLALVREALRKSELPPRVFNPTHVNRRKALFAEALELAATGVPIDLTAFPVEEGDGSLSALDGLAEYRAARRPPELLTISSDAGGSLPVFGLDGRVVSHEVAAPDALLQCVTEWLARGEPLEVLLPTITANPAALLRLRGKGRLEVGQDADCVVLTPSGTLVDVMANGVWLGGD